MILKITWKNLRSKPFSTFFTLIGISVALTFLGSLWTIVENIDRVRGEKKDSDVLITVFLDSQLSAEEMISVKEEITKFPLVAGVTQISKDEAIEGMEAEFGSVLSKAIGKDALPTALNLELKKKNISNKEAQSLIVGIRSIKGVLELDTGMEAFPGSGESDDNFKILNWTWVLFIMVVSVVALLVSHLIRLAFEGSKPEIETMKIMGASRKFLIFPLMLEGLAYGVLGALVSICSVYLVVKYLFPLFVELFLPDNLEISFLSTQSVFLLFLTSIGASIIGALLTMPIITQKQSEIL